MEIYKYLKAFPYNNNHDNINNNNNNNNNSGNDINNNNTSYRKVEIPAIPDSPPKKTDWGENAADPYYRGPYLSYDSDSIFNYLENSIDGRSIIL